VTSIRAGGAESADMSLSDRERSEGFQLSLMSAVAVEFPLTVGERPEGFQRTPTSTVLSSNPSLTVTRSIS